MPSRWHPIRPKSKCIHQHGRQYANRRRICQPESRGLNSCSKCGSAIEHGSHAIAIRRNDESRNDGQIIRSCGVNAETKPFLAFDAAKCLIKFTVIRLKFSMGRRSCARTVNRFFKPNEPINDAKTSTLDESRHDDEQTSSLPATDDAIKSSRAISCS